MNDICLNLSRSDESTYFTNHSAKSGYKVWIVCVNGLQPAAGYNEEADATGL